MKIVIPDAWTKPHDYYMHAGLRQERKKALGKPKKEKDEKKNLGREEWRCQRTHYTNSSGNKTRFSIYLSRKIRELLENLRTYSFSSPRPSLPPPPLGWNLKLNCHCNGKEEESGVSWGEEGPDQFNINTTFRTLWNSSWKLRSYRIP